MASIFTDLMTNIDKGIAASFSGAAAGMTAYVLPIGWAMFGISLLVWAFMVIEGKIHSPMNDWIMKGLYMLLVLTAAGTSYTTWVSAPLFALPNELSSAITNAGSSTAALDQLSDSLDQLIIGMAQAMADAFGDFNFGGGLILLVSIIAVALAGSLLEIACMFNMIYAKIGLALVLGVGPFFVLCLFWGPTKQWFYSWMNTVLYFVFLSVMTTMIMLLFITIANTFMGKLMNAVQAASDANAGFAHNVYAALKAVWNGEPLPSSSGAGAVVNAQLNILSVSFQIVLVFLPMFFVALEVRSMVASMTGGSGGSFGGGVMAVAQQLKGAKGGGGK